ncbi:MAG TPA: hemerythrin domain-containing protein [Flavipsychrobacter sp.]
MESRKPIKRSSELVPLSRDHHSGLLLCWKIKTGLQKNVGTDRIANYVVFYYQAHLKEHFRQEEEYVFPLLDKDDPLIEKALSEHGELATLIAGLENAIPVEPTSLEKLMNLLEAHIRYEERELFPYIEQKSGDSGLKNAGEIIAELHNNITEPAWDDEFWARTI